MSRGGYNRVCRREKDPRGIQQVLHYYYSRRD